MKRLIIVAMLSLLMALVLAACGGQVQEAVEEVAPTVAAAVEEEMADEDMADEEMAEEEMAEDEMAEATCEDALGCVEIAGGDPILIASALVISGPNGDLGLDSQRGVEIALKMRGEVAGHSLELQAEDDGCNAEGGQAAGTKIVANPQVVGVIGTSCSGAGVPMSSIISDAGYVMVSPSNTSPALTDPDRSWNPGYLRTAHNDEVQGPAMADYAYNEQGARRAAVIHDGDPYTEGLATSFSNAFTAIGGEVVAFEAEAPDATNVEPLLTTIAASEPDFVFYPVFIPLGALITNTAKDIAALEGVQLAAADGVQSPSFLENVVETGEGMVSSGPDLAFSNSFYEEEFLPMYMEDYGLEPTAPFHAHSYDATMLLLDAIEAVAQHSDDGLLIGRQALRDALYATNGYVGVTGTLTCNEYGDCADAKIAVSEVQDNAFERIWP